MTVCSLVRGRSRLRLLASFGLLALVEPACTEPALTKDGLPKAAATNSSSGPDAGGTGQPDAGNPEPAPDESAEPTPDESEEDSDSASENPTPNPTPKDPSSTPGDDDEDSTSVPDDPTTPEPSPKNACEAAGFRCVERAPNGWEGPVRLDEAGAKADLESCTSPEPMLRNTVSGATGSLPQCRGCKAHIQAPSCSRIKFQYFNRGECEPGSEARLIELKAECQTIPDMHGDSGIGKFVLPEPEGDASCLTTVPPDPNIPKPEFENFYRGCSAQQTEDCGSSDAACLDAREAKSCIYREGRHSCPSGTYSKNILSFAKIDDTRSCGTCEPLVENYFPQCSGVFTAYSTEHAQCHPDNEVARESYLETPTLHNECFSASSLAFARWWSIKFTKPELGHSGRCVTHNWGPKGALNLKDPVTYCCAD